MLLYKAFTSDRMLLLLAPSQQFIPFQASSSGDSDGEVCVAFIKLRMAICLKVHISVELENFVL